MLKRRLNGRGDRIGETRLTRNEDDLTLIEMLPARQYNAGVEGGRTQRIGMLAWPGKVPRGVAACACVVNAAAAATIIQVVSNSAKTDERTSRRAN